MLALILMMTAAAAVDSPQGAASAQSVDGGRNWVYTTDYPEAALRELRGGVTTVRLTVSRTGEVDGCAIAASSGHADLDAVSCMAMVMRGHYQPARDERGRAVASVVLRQIVWDPRAASLPS